MNKNISLILASTIEGGIGYDYKLPWDLPSELKKFRYITSKVSNEYLMNAVIMGKDTWESMNRKPLKNRLNIVLTRNKICNLNPMNYKNVIIANSIIDALVYADQKHIENIYIIGGAKLYNTFLQSEFYFKLIDKIFLSIIFYDKKIVTNKFIDINSIFINFKIYKDNNYKKECDNRLFASYICIPKKHFTINEDMLYLL